MAAEQDLTTLIRGMKPVLASVPYAIFLSDVPIEGAFATVAEDEAVTVIAPRRMRPDAAPWARISLSVQSDLFAVGLTAAFATALAAEGISANVVAGYHHDHIFLPWERRHDAMAALERLSRDA